MIIKNTLPWITDLEKTNVLSALDEANLSGFSGTLTPGQLGDLKIFSANAINSSIAFLGGKLVRECEYKIAEICNSKYCILMNSATSALMAGIAALDLPPKSLIGLPTVSFSATIAAVIAAGHQPVYVDIDATCTADPRHLKEVISSRSIKAFIFVQWAGNGKNLNAVEEICNNHNIFLIEDSSQATMTESPDGRFNGSVGSLGIFSFNGPKNLSSGEGGCIITNDPDIAFYSRLTRNHGEAALISPKEVDLNRFKVGLNLRPTEITAALALSQLSRRHELHNLREKNFKFLCDSLSGILDAVDGSKEQKPYCGSFFLSSDQKGLKAALLEEASKQGIPLFGNYPLEHWEIGASFGENIDLQDFPGTLFYLERYVGIFSIAYPNLEENMSYLAGEIKRILDAMPVNLEIKERSKSFNIGRTL
jgi:dTDP-4-amino-4,6-dideoxygalactose transaminase